MNRRRLLGIVSGSVLVGTGGCLGATTTTPGDAVVSDETTETSPDDGVETPGEPVVRFTVENRIYRERFLSVHITRDGDPVVTQTVKTHGVGKRGMDGELTPGETYHVVAELDSGDRFESDWKLSPNAQLLTFVVTVDETVSVVEVTSGDPLGADFPYTIAGAEDIFVPPGLDVRNESDEDVTLSVALEHDGDHFFDRTLELGSGRQTTTDPIVDSHGTYDVVVETADGRQTIDEWRVPESWGWPTLAVLVAEDGTLGVGGGWPQEVVFPVENEDETASEVVTTIANRDEVVAETRQTVAPGTDRLTATLPLGDEYEVTVETDAGRDTAAYVACECWHSEATIHVEEGVPSIETVQYFCS
ncbi:hypothetical protein [Haloferax profundi]|uniref:Ig-like domain-containing protein n=1 Tax=Haloferax profundi TaxID=1544718 RepID=A0A0W1SMI6_9EURY|nr:hypothetical protein [Haloferax profundi]KTG27416.1 hypothetical protein AUR66_14220 [Haloferax profundi]